MNKITTILAIVIMALSFVLGATLQSKAQQSKSFAGIMPFVTTSNRIGFFDQTSGRVYVYDDNISQCLFTGQMTALGKPIQPLTAGQ